MDAPLPPCSPLFVHDHSLLGVVALTELLAKATATAEIFSDYLEKYPGNYWLGKQLAQRRDAIAAALELARLTAEYHPDRKHIRA